MTLGQRIQELRKQAGLSQEGLGEALGVSRQAVSKWESDGGIPELDTLIAMSRLFHITVGQLLGVETSEKQEKVPETAPGFTEEQVEDILRRYAEESRPPRETPASWLAKWGWIPAAAIVAITVIAVLFARVNSLQSNVRMLQNDVNNLSNNMSNLSGTIRNSIYDILAEETELLNTFDWTLEDFDLERETVTLSLKATLKEYKAGSTLQFIFDCTKTDQSKEQVVSQFVAGPNFSVVVTLPMNYHTEVSIRLQDEEGNLQEQLVDYIYSLQVDHFQLEGYNLKKPFRLTISRFGAISMTATSEEAFVDIYSAYPDVFWPESAHITARVNDEEVFSEEMSLTQSMDDPGSFRAGIRDTYFEVKLVEGDAFEVELQVEDNFGRIQTFLSGGTVNDGELKGMPEEARVTHVD